ncbi:MAG: OmpP1/FadL family transporter, partial [Vicinamibacterales bacterium]
VELSQRADLSTQVITGTNLTFAALGVPRGTDFADIRLKGHTVQAGFHLGVLIKPNDMFSVGARYLSKQTVETDDGDFEPTQINTGLRTPVPLPGIPAGTPLDALLQPQFASGARLATQKVSTSIPLPDQLVVGFMVRPVEAMKVKVDYQFTNWSLFDTLVITTENGLVQTNVEDYKDTHGIRVGTEYSLSPETRLRAGVLAHGGAAPEQTVTPLLPEGKRIEFTLGGGHQFTDRLGVDLAYQYLHQPDRRGRVSDGGLAKPTAAVNSGEYAFRANLLAMNLTLKW